MDLPTMSSTMWNPLGVSRNLLVDLKPHLKILSFKQHDFNFIFSPFVVVVVVVINTHIWVVAIKCCVTLGNPKQQCCQDASQHVGLGIKFKNSSLHGRFNFHC